MAKGGARARSGPPPDPAALRRERDEGDWKILPAAGRAGTAPKWPLSKQTAREKTIWAREWKRPQAIMWERNGQEVEVALYVRSLVAAEHSDAPVNARTLVVRQQEALGLSIPGLARNRWRIEDTPAAGGQATPAARPRSTGSARDRFKVVTGGRG